MELFDYQADAVEAVYAHLESRKDNPCVVIPTGGGKTPVIARIAGDVAGPWGGRVLVLAHVKELLEQSADKMRKLCGKIEVGIYSAGLGRKEASKPITVAGIQSAWRNAHEFDRIDLAIVDEAHLISFEDDGMYRRFFADLKLGNPDLRIVGLTATPYRMKEGLICTSDGILNHVCYEIGLRELIDRGRLCNLISKAGAVKADLSRVDTLAGEFHRAQAEAAMDRPELVAEAVAEIVELTQNRNAVLTFTAGVQHAEHVCAELRRRGQTPALITGETPAAQRAAILGDLREGRLKHLVNVRVLTTGFDATRIDAVAIMVPTKSPGLLYQMCGRGLRVDPSKTDCLILDFGGNLLRHGPIDLLKPKEKKNRAPGETFAPPAKECPQCGGVVPTAFRACPYCAFEFPPPAAAKHDAEASTAGVLAGQTANAWFDVVAEAHAVHVKKSDPTAPRTMRVSYWCGGTVWFSEWICIEHPAGYGRDKARAWWRKRTHLPFPASVDEAVGAGEAGKLARTERIRVKTKAGSDFPEIIAHDLGPIPTLGGLSSVDEHDDIPF